MSRFALLLALLLGSVAMVANAGESYVHNLPLPAHVTAPEWLQIREPDPAVASTFASWEFGIKAPENTGDLAVTFYFTEKEGGFLKLYWQGATEAETLCDNLYDGVVMPNQKTILIPKSVIHSGGTLTVLSGTSDTGIQRVEWNWVTPTTIAVVDTATTPALLRAGNQPLRAEEISGNEPVPTSDRIHGNAVSAVIQEEPVRIEQGVEFLASLEAVPPLARIEVQLLGVPLNRNIAVWINGVPVNQLSLDVPDLSDPGYLPPTETSAPVYIGWRKGTVFVPASALREGENLFRFAWIENDPTASVTTPLALKNFFLQLNFDAAPTVPTATNLP